MVAIQLLFVIFCGLTFGSFITLASYRLPLGEDIVFKPSRCPKCDKNLTFLDLWPVLTWLMAGGKCRHCKTAVSVRYPAIELITAIVFMMLFGRYGLTLQALLLGLFAVALLIMIVADLEHFIIPDEIHYALLPLGIAYHWVVGTPWEEVAGGFALGAALGLLLHHGYRFVRKKEGLGYGDVKFLAIAGLWLGVMPMPAFLFYSGILGIITGLIWRILGKGPIFPFGPALAVALFGCVAYPELPNLFLHISQYLR